MPAFIFSLGRVLMVLVDNGRKRLSAKNLTPEPALHRRGDRGRRTATRPAQPAPPRPPRPPQTCAGAERTRRRCRLRTPRASLLAARPPVGARAWRPVGPAGMPLDAANRLVWERMCQEPRLHDLPVEEARQRARRYASWRPAKSPQWRVAWACPVFKDILMAPFDAAWTALRASCPQRAWCANRSFVPAEEVHSVEDLTAPGPESRIPIRVYRPAIEGEALSILVYLHGGGYYYGGLDWNDPLCRTLADHTPCVVVGVDYRLAPEHNFPAAIEMSKPLIVTHASGKSNFD